MSIEVSGLAGLGADLVRAAVEVQQGTRGVVSKGALNIKTSWRDNAIASGGTHAQRLYPRTVNYDLHPLPGGATAEIGPDRSQDDRQASFGAILEFGSVHNPPHNDGGKALDAEEPRFIAAAQALVDRALQ